MHTQADTEYSFFFEEDWNNQLPTYNSMDKRVLEARYQLWLYFRFKCDLTRYVGLDLEKTRYICMQESLQTIKEMFALKEQHDPSTFQTFYMIQTDTFTCSRSKIWNCREELIPLLEKIEYEELRMGMDFNVRPAKQGKKWSFLK